MVSPKKTRRQRIVEAADRLVQRQGFNQTTLADVAKVSRVALGNIHYYFRTKEILGEALIAERTEMYRTLREQWQGLPGPKDRLLAFIQMTVDNRELLTRSGCPIGSLCQELSKERGKLATQAADMFTEFLTWLEAQFQDLGKGDHSYDLAVHLMVILEGATLLTNSLRTPAYIVKEAERMKDWVRSL